MVDGQLIVIKLFGLANFSTDVKVLARSRLIAYSRNSRPVAVSVPYVSGEKRAELACHVKKLGEETTFAVRSIRQDARKQIRARGKGSEWNVQQATDAAVEELKSLVKGETRDLGV